MNRQSDPIASCGIQQKRQSKTGSAKGWNMARLLIIAGPSCAGKSPLLAAVKKLHPDVLEGVKPVVLCNSRSPRPGEKDGVDYDFRKREEIKELRNDPEYLVMDVRGDLQALNLKGLEDSESDLIFEGNPFVGSQLMKLRLPPSMERLGVFVSPLSKWEVERLKEMGADIPKVLTMIMRRKLLRRARGMLGMLSLPDLEEIERRAESAPREMEFAQLFDYVLPNHDGEDSGNWSDFYYPVGDALRTMRGIIDLWTGKDVPWAEVWKPGDPWEEVE
ncbi:MAG: hypothetical protein GF388_04270 [Candidatus Aegiribacteria sp.]|nr:hypothetical protein [Candidatus Aegiribacteria sp.]MBD3294454.1 hypothetical protein [Candidatus Fermentibacteria bacterium]